MAFKPFVKLYMTVLNFEKPENILRTINQLQTNIEQSLFTLINDRQQNDSNILTDISLSTGQDNIIAHKLGRKLRGWKIIRLRGNAIVYDDQDNQQFPNLNLTLLTTADVVVDIEVF